MSRFADIVLPLAQPAYTFAVPEGMTLAEGQAVLVQFGANRYYTGIVWRLHDRRPDFRRIKPVLRPLYGVQLLGEEQRRFWEWVASYYMCSLGEVMRVALPALMKPSGSSEEEFAAGEFRPRSETWFSLREEFRSEERLHELFEKLGRRAPRQYEALLEIVAALLPDPQNAAGIPASDNALATTAACSAATCSDVVPEAAGTPSDTAPMAADAVSTPTSGDPSESFSDDTIGEGASAPASDASIAASCDAEALLAAPLPPEVLAGAVPRRLLAAERPVLHQLERKGVIRAEERERQPGAAQDVRFRLPILSPAQGRCLTQIRELFASRTGVLLHGVTGSGKTEIYIHLIAETLRCGDDVLLLVPEIALTAQLVERMERIFGSRVTVYHSRLTERARTETYLRLCRSEGGEFVVGARSALFLPLRRLRLVVVDEEHDTSYKQSDPAPRYNARDCAVVAASLFGGHVLLGSATPSLETWLNAARGKYGKVVLGERYGEARPPRIVISDTLRAVKRGERKAHFNKQLLDAIGERLDRGEQVMLFQNRRGFSPYVECPECGWTARCPNCNVTLTYHRGGSSERLVCHYCGHTEAVPVKCPACRVTDLAPRGFGTEKVEEEIARLFPRARVARLDRDSVTSERAFRSIVAGFARLDTDILVGTQMISKGFDFEGVSLVGILNADNLVNSPDFRAAERAFQLMTQVAGRAGRRAVPGEVIIQTSDPTSPVIRQVAASDYEAMARQQLAERHTFFYPPYARLVALTLRHRDPELLHRGARALAEALRSRFGRRVLGPMTPPVNRIRGEYLAGVLLKVESGASFTRAREVLREVLDAFAAGEEFRRINLQCDVDPQ